MQGIIKKITQTEDSAWAELEGGERVYLSKNHGLRDGDTVTYDQLTSKAGKPYFKQQEQRKAYGGGSGGGGKAWSKPDEASIATQTLLKVSSELYARTRSQLEPLEWDQEMFDTIVTSVARAYRATYNAVKSVHGPVSSS
jgi:hypothetical protein